MKKLFSHLVFFMIMCLPGLQAQQKIGGTVGAVNPSAILELESTSRGLLLPRLTTAQRDAITVGPNGLPKGLVIFNTEIDCVEYYTGSSWRSLCQDFPADNAAVVTTNCGGQVVPVPRPVSGIPVTGYFINVPYTGGNGGTYSPVSITSTGVNGLTAKLLGSGVATGDGQFTFEITGTPATSGTAGFEFNFPGQPSCLINVPIADQAAVVTLPACNNGSVLAVKPAGTSLTAGTAVPSDAFVKLPYSGGNGGSYPAINVSSAGIAGMLVAAPPGNVKSGDDSLQLNLSGTPTAGPGGNAAFTINFANNTCQFLVAVLPGGGTVDAFTNCGSGGAYTGPAITQGTTYTAGSNAVITLSYTGGNGGPYPTVSRASNADGVQGLTATLTGSNFAVGSGNLAFVITGTPTSAGVATFSINVGGKACDLAVNVQAGNAPLPGNITLTAGQKRFISSVRDNNYLPYNAPTTPATAATGAPGANPDGVTETLVDIAGSLSTTGVIVRIPYTVTGSTAASLPAFTQTKPVPASLTEDNIARDVTLTYQPRSLNPGNGYIDATLKAESGTLNVKQLDINTGVGNDGLGVLLAEFTIPVNATATGTVQLRAIPVIPDRNFSNTSYRFVYLPVSTATGKVWLDNNLGANYSRLNASWIAGRQATSSTDRNAYGSLFQWGRYSDNHELINHTESNKTSLPVMGAVSVPTGVGSDAPADTRFIMVNNTSTANTYRDWRSDNSSPRWNNGINNPCPQGYHVPTSAEWTAEINAYSMGTSFNNAFNSPLKLTRAGARGRDDSLLYGLDANARYWGTPGGTPGIGGGIRSSSGGGVSVNGLEKSFGASVRCISN